ncbi:hypothetical protein M3Y94_00336200 [Aphelenchoides besseyi]|nr:hypothetical protein M3Y94_00336200 [Aphelenchoides besseyi]
MDITKKDANLSSVAQNGKLHWEKYSVNDRSKMERPLETTELPFPIIEASILMTIVAFFALIVNLYLLNCSRYLRKPISVNLRLCVSLTASNAFCGFFYMASNIINVLVPAALQSDGLISNCFAILIEILKIATFFASVFTLLSLALNHYIGIVFPLKRHGGITPRTVRTVILLAHLLPIMFFLLLFTIVPGGFRAEKAFAFFSKNGCQGNIFQIFGVRVSIALPFIIFVLIISALYLHILVFMYRKSNDPILHNSKSLKKPATNRRLLITILLLVGSAVIGWLPTLMQFILVCRGCIFQLPLKQTFYIGVISQLVNVLKLLFDAFVYTQRLIEIRYAMWIFHRSILQKLGFRGTDVELEMSSKMPKKFARYAKSGGYTQSNATTRRHVKKHIPAENSESLGTLTSVNNYHSVDVNQSPTTALLDDAKE